MQRHFRILDVELSLCGPHEILRPVFFAYRRFETDAPQSTNVVRLVLDSPDERVLHVNERAVPLVRGWDITLQVYQQFLIAMMDGIRSHAILHAAALATRQGQAIVLAAPSGHGKSSLTLELARRGLSFLSDDFAPLELATSLVTPFPRAVSVRPRNTAPIPEPFRRTALDPAAVRLFGKSLLDIGQILGEQSLASGPVPLRHVILLGPSAGADQRLPATFLHVASRVDHALELEQLWSSIAGVEVIEREEEPELRFWTLRLNHEHYPTGALSKILDSDRILFCEKYWYDRPSFTEPPRAARIARRVAAEYLGRELLNRRGSSCFLAAYGGKVTQLFLHLAGALHHVDCWKVRVGGCEQTADLIQRLTES